MAVASASLAVSIDAGYGHTVSCWRLHNMTTTHSQQLRMQMIDSLPTIRSLLKSSLTSLSACERNTLNTQLEKFATLVAENMANYPDDPITILLYSITHPASMEGRVSDEVDAVFGAIISLERGDWGGPIWESSTNNPPHTSQATS